MASSAKCAVTRTRCKIWEKFCSKPAALKNNDSTHSRSYLNNTLQILQMIFSHLSQTNCFMTRFHGFASLTWNPAITNISGSVVTKVWDVSYTLSQVFTVHVSISKALQIPRTRTSWIYLTQHFPDLPGKTSLHHLPWDTYWYPKKSVYSTELSGKWIRPTLWSRSPVKSDTRTWSVEHRNTD